MENKTASVWCWILMSACDFFIVFTLSSVDLPFTSIFKISRDYNK